MEVLTTTTRTADRIIIKRCHVCGKLTDSVVEIQRCPCCNKSFLPANYFGKVHTKNDEDFSSLFMSSDDLNEEDLIKGLNVIW